MAAGGIAACPPRHSVGVKFTGTLYLCIWLCIWCVSASKTETHRYTRIRNPHPVYLTSRAAPSAHPAQRPRCNPFSYSRAFLVDKDAFLGEDAARIPQDHRKGHGGLHAGRRGAPLPTPRSARRPIHSPLLAPARTTRRPTARRRGSRRRAARRRRTTRRSRAARRRSSRTTTRCQSTGSTCTSSTTTCHLQGLAERARPRRRDAPAPPARAQVGEGGGRPLLPRPQRVRPRVRAGVRTPASRNRLRRMTYVPGTPRACMSMSMCVCMSLVCL